MFFGKLRHREPGLATAERRPEWAEADRLASSGDLAGAIECLRAANAASRDPDLERRIRQFRHVAGIELIGGPAAEPQFARPAETVPPIGEQSGVPEVTTDELTAEVLRAAMLSKGCILVRGLLARDSALAFAEDIDRAFEVRDGLAPGETDPDGYYDEIIPEPPYAVMERPLIESGGGVLAADSPKLLFQMIEVFKAAGLGSVIAEYLGEPPAISAQKCTLRRSTANLDKAWHQDGKFLGDVRSVNVWLSLSRCGDVAPGLDLVPRRLDHHAETWLSIGVADELAEELAGEDGVKRPIFEPGDALLFDDMFLHSTGSDPDMPNPRYAIESWFFGPSAYPEGYVPIAF